MSGKGLKNYSTIVPIMQTMAEIETMLAKHGARKPGMKIAIAGAGLTGAYIYKLLKGAGFNDITVYDQKHFNTCGINPCAWGTNSPGIEWYLERAGLNPANYILRQFDRAVFDDMEIKINLATINKPRLIKDLLDGAEIKYEPLVNIYDRVIDATGTARAYLPPIDNDVLAPTIQYRMGSGESPQLKLKLGKIGYAWCFPLSGYHFHVGASSMTTDPSSIIGNLGWMYGDGSTHKNSLICSCTGNIRVTAPRGSQPFVHNNVWGIGEAIGCVSPLAGDGIIPGLRSAWILFQNWMYHGTATPGIRDNYSPGNAGEYVDEILREFKWMEIERKIIDKFRQGKNVGLWDAWKLHKNPRRMGMDLSTLQTLKLFRRYL